MSAGSQIASKPSSKVKVIRDHAYPPVDYIAQEAAMIDYLPPSVEVSDNAVN